MRKFIINISVFVAVFFLVDKLFYLFLIVSPSYEKDVRLEKVINGEMNKDLVVFGSSRGARNILAGMIQDSLGISSYNLSYPGSDIEFHEFLLSALLTFNEPPKTILLAIDEPHELLPCESLKFRFDRLYPLAKYKYINDEMIRQGEKNFLSRIMVLARINRRNFMVKEKQFTALDSISSCGSMPISFQRTDREVNFDSTSYIYDTSLEIPEKVNAFMKFQQECIANNIQLYLVFSPNLMIRNPLFEKRLRELAYPEVQFYVYDKNNEIYRNKAYYYDEGHLITRGAILFTNEIIQVLKHEVNTADRSQ